MEIVQGSRIRFDYRLAFAVDGTLIESAEDVELVIGDGSIDSSLECALCGLKDGDERELLLTPETGFGCRDPQQVYALPKSDFPAAISPQEGQVISFDLPNGENMPGTVLALEGAQVKMDFNHPLAGYDLKFRVKIIAVRAPA